MNAKQRKFLADHIRMVGGMGTVHSSHRLSVHGALTLPMSHKDAKLTLDSQIQGIKYLMTLPTTDEALAQIQVLPSVSGIYTLEMKCGPEDYCEGIIMGGREGALHLKSAFSTLVYKLRNLTDDKSKKA